MRNAADKTERSEILAFLRKCWAYYRKKEFRSLVLNGYHNPDFFELRSCGEEYRGQIIYQVEAFGCAVGFFAEFLYTLIRLYFAAERGLTPYVHWGEDFLYYERDGIENQYNAFLYYFEPVSDVEGINNAAHVLRATDDHIHAVQDALDTHGYAVTEKYMNALSNMIRQYIRYNDNTRKFLEEGYTALIGDKKALAVHFRGTDYRRQYNNHPVFVTIEQEIARVREIFDRRDYEVIFLATDEQEAVDTFRREFGDVVRVFEDTWRSDGGNESVAYSHSDRRNHHYLLGLEVLRDQYMLTRSAGLVCGISNLTLSARMMRRAWYDTEYEDLVILDNDLCHNDRQFCDATH